MPTPQFQDNMTKSRTTKRSSKSSEVKEELKLISSKNLSCHDIFMGRGNAVTNTSGNTTYRVIVWKYREMYATASRDKKQDIAKQVMKEVYAQNPPGRFLEKISDDVYSEVSSSRILEKCCQSLREKKYKEAPWMDLSSRPVKKRSSQKNLSQKTKIVTSSVKTNPKHKSRARTVTEKKPKKAKTVPFRKTKATEKKNKMQSDIIKTVEHHESVDCNVDEELVIYDKASFINAKKLLLASKKTLPETRAPPLEQPFVFQSIALQDDSFDVSDGDSFEGMFNMVPLNLIEFYSCHAADNRISHEKTREESIESPTTVIDDFGFAPPIPLQIANSLYLEDEHKWVNPSDNVTANVVAAWTEFATSGACS